MDSLNFRYLIHGVRLTQLLGATSMMVFMTLMAGCATTSHPIHDYCQIAHPICMKSGEPALLSDATDRQIDTHNETGAKICGWKGCKTH